MHTNSAPGQFEKSCSLVRQALPSPVRKNDPNSRVIIVDSKNGDAQRAKKIKRGVLQVLAFGDDGGTRHNSRGEDFWAAARPSSFTNRALSCAISLKFDIEQARTPRKRKACAVSCFH
jgi:hypothetical protein